MKRKNWYMLALFLPILLPVVWLFSCGWAMAYVDSYPWRHIPSHHFRYIDTLLGMMAVSLFFGGVQYLLFAIAVVVWAMAKPAEQLARVSWFLPLFFYPICSLGLAVFLSFFGFIIGFFCLPVGYGYVLLVHLLTWLFTRLRLIEPAYAGA